MLRFYVNNYVSIWILVNYCKHTGCLYNYDTTEQEVIYLFFVTGNAANIVTEDSIESLDASSLLHELIHDELHLRDIRFIRFRSCIRLLYKSKGTSSTTWSLATSDRRLSSMDRCRKTTRNSDEFSQSLWSYMWTPHGFRLYCFIVGSSINKADLLERYVHR